MNKFRVLILLVGLSAQAAFAADPSARQAMEKNETARRLNDVQSDATLKNGTGQNVEKTKKFTWWRKLKADGIHYDTLTRFHAPAEIRDEGILFIEQENGQADVLMYLPNFKKTRRVEKQAQNGSFMGSEFSYADIATPHLDDFEYATMKKEACPDGGSCLVIESKPKNDDIKERIGYSKQLLWIRLDNFMISKGEYFDLDGKLRKKFTASDTREVDTKQHRWMSHQLKMENPDNGKFTIMEFSDVKVNAGIPDSKFTKQSLERP